MADELRPDIRAARDRMTVRFGTRRHIVRLATELVAGEQVLHLAKGAYDNAGGLVALTDRRLLFLKGGRSAPTTVSFHLATIASAQWSPAVLTGRITLVAGGRHVELKEIEKPDCAAMVDTIRRLITPGPLPVDQDEHPTTGLDWSTLFPPESATTEPDWLIRAMSGGWTIESHPTKADTAEPRPPATTVEPAAASGNEVGCLTALFVLGAVVLAVWALLSHSLRVGAASLVVGAVVAAPVAVSWLKARAASDETGDKSRRVVPIGLVSVALAAGVLGFGHSAWYRWVSCAPEPAAELAGCDLAGRDLADVDLSGADLSGADLTGADLTGADLTQADLTGAVLSEAVLSSTDLSGSTIADADLSSTALDGSTLAGADLSGANLDGRDLSGVNLSGADLREATLTTAILTGADLSGADLSEADLSFAVLDHVDLTATTMSAVTLDHTGLVGAELAALDLSGVDLSGANLRAASLAGTVLSRADLNGANLADVRATGASFDQADLSEADLSGADLTESDLTEADLASAEVTSALFNGATLNGADLTEAEIGGASFSGADLTGAVLTALDMAGANLSGAILVESDLTGSALTGADLTSADLTSADLSSVDLTDAATGSIVLNQANLEGVQGLADADLAAGLGVSLDELVARLITDNQRLESREAATSQLGAACTADTVGRVDYQVGGTIAVLDAGGTAPHGDADLIASELGMFFPPAARMASLIVCVGDQADVLIESCQYSVTGAPPYDSVVERYRKHLTLRVVDLRRYPDVRIREVEVEGAPPRDCGYVEMFNLGQSVGILSGDDVDGPSIAAALRARL